MKYAVFSDVHGNLFALNYFIEQVDKVVDGYICLGDIVGYGPFNDACLERIYDLKNIVILNGNHEEIFKTQELSHCSQLAKDFFEVSNKNFSRFDLLPQKNVYNLNNWTFKHSFKNEDSWIYVYDEDKVPFNTHGKFCIGHTHRQAIIKNSNYVIINVGSIGQNREDNNLVCWGIYDSDKGFIDLYKQQYKKDEFIQCLIEKKYPSHLIKYYL